MKPVDMALFPPFCPLVINLSVIYGECDLSTFSYSCLSGHGFFKNNVLARNVQKVNQPSCYITCTYSGADPGFDEGGGCQSA